MKIVVDDKIPYILPALHELADEVVAKAGSSITTADVVDADILVVRTRTRCNQALLANSRVRLIVTATIGFDHLDTAYLKAAGIEWHNCPGCNATSVAQYIRNSLWVLRQTCGLDLEKATIGIVGVGHVGTAVAEALTQAGLRRLLLNDPLCEARGEVAPCDSSWCTLEQIQAEADIVTFHTPLTRDGVAPTFHLADASFFQHLHKPIVLLNAARGGVVDEDALLQAMDEGKVSQAVIDTWEGEPNLRADLLQRAFIATPHIAGYSADGKANATRMTLATICQFLGRPMTFDIQPPALPAPSSLPLGSVEQDLQLYDPRHDSMALKEHPEQFEHLRGHYPLRREHI